MKNIIKKWIHLNEDIGYPWIHPIWTAKNNAVSSGKTSELSQEIIEVGGYISIRLNMLPRIVQRINSECIELYNSIKDIDPEYEYSVNKNGRAFRINDDLKYNILIDIDALLFELNSCWKLIKKLFVKLYRHVKIPLKKEGLDTTWAEELKRHRDFFIHSGAPYFAVNISDVSKYDLIIMKENLNSFNDPEKFLQLSDIDDIVKGFIDSKSVIKNNLIELFKKL